MIYLIKGKGKVRGEYVGVADDPKEQEHALWLAKGFKPAPSAWEPPAPKADSSAGDETEDNPKPKAKKSSKKRPSKKR